MVTKNIKNKMKLFLLYLVIVLNTLNIYYAFALEVCSSNYILETDLKQEDCPEKTHYFSYSKNPFCFPMCSPVQTVKRCSTNTNPCTPGYMCVKGNCVIDEDSCLKYYNSHPDVPNKYLKAFIKPKCDEKTGKWLNKQCKGEAANGRCYCYDDVGNRIFGDEWSNKAQNMTCACSKRKAELFKQSDRFYITLHCDTNGNYEPLQCDSKQCWCVEPTTGKLTSKVVLEDYVKYLPCYKKQDFGDQYLRQCESHELANAMITNKMKIHGTMYSNLQIINCDADGSYSSIQMVSGIATCSWKDGKPIGSFQAPGQQRGNMDCKCACDKKLYEVGGKAFLMDCENNGNYLYEQQTQDNKYYCVDSDGFKISENYYDNLPSREECNKYLSF